LFLIRSCIALTVWVLVAPHTANPIEQPALLAGARGTLVSFVPANNALVVAADSRSTTLGVRCDGRTKLAIPKFPPRTIVAGTGTSEWVSARFPLWDHDPCGDIEKNGVTFFDAKDIARKYLEEKQQAIWLLDLKDFANRIVKAIIEVAQHNPEYVRGFAGRTMFQLVLGAFDPETNTSYVRAVQFNLTEQSAIDVKLSADYKFTNADHPDYPHFGDTITFTTHVILGTGKRHLPASLESIQGKSTIAQVSIEEASDLAINLIEAAKLTSSDVPELNSIGGAVAAYLIDAKSVTRIR
jgi:hypothetical protein